MRQRRRTTFPPLLTGMKTIALAFVTLSSSLLIACGSSDDELVTRPENNPSPLVSSISSEYGDENYVYDEKDRLISCEFTPVENSFYNFAEYSCRYEYPDDRTIKSCLTQKHHVFSDTERVYDAVMTLGDNGYVSCVDGFFTLYENDELQMYKKYRHEFEYDGSGALVKLIWTEWSQKWGGDWNYEHPWRWENFLTWENGNLIRYVDYNGNKKPNLITEYYYSGIPMTTVRPIAVPYISPMYSPLQCCGLFGVQPKNEVMAYRFCDRVFGEERHVEYSYEFTETASGTLITRYWQKVNDLDAVGYRVNWQ